MPISKIPVILSTPYWNINGVNIFCMNLARGLKEHRRYDVRIIVTKHDLKSSNPMEEPGDIDFVKLPSSRRAPWKVRARGVYKYLVDSSPCIYIPNHDYDHSVVSSILPSNVGIIGIMHNSHQSTEDQHFEQLAGYWNWGVGVSKWIASKIERNYPELQGRVSAIPCIPDVPKKAPQGDVYSEEQILRIVYAGRIEQSQKRVKDYIGIMNKVRERDLPVALTVIGDGIAMNEFRRESMSLIESGHITLKGSISNDKVIDEYKRHHVFLLVSQYEGFPVSLFEAMAHGCLPVVSAIESGVPELIESGTNGYVCPIGDVAAFADVLEKLVHSPVLVNQMRLNAHRTLIEHRFTKQRMVEDYCEIFDRIRNEIESGIYQRPRGTMTRSPITKPVSARQWLSYYGHRIMGD